MGPTATVELRYPVPPLSPAPTHLNLSPLHWLVDRWVVELHVDPRGDGGVREPR